MKNFLMILIALLFISCQKKEATQPGDYSLDGFETEKIKGTGLLSATKTNANGIMTDEGFIMNGKQHGPWKTYEPNRGYLESITYFSEGQQIGSILKFDSRGTITEELSYLNGELHGKTIKYRYGLKIAERNYKMGKSDGRQYDYYENGKIQTVAEFKDGVQDGIYEYYTFEGEKQLSYQYKNGEIVSREMSGETSK